MSSERLHDPDAPPTSEVGARGRGLMAVVVPGGRGSATSPAPVGPREARITRLMARFVGGGFIAYLLASAGEFVPTAAYVAPWFTPAGAAAAFLPGIALFAYSFRRRLDHAVVAVLAYSTSIGYLLACVLWVLAWDGIASGVDRVTWLMSFGGLPSLAVVLVRPLAIGVVHLAICITASTIITNLGRVGEIGWIALPQALWGVAYSSIFLIAASMIRRTGRSLDAAREVALRATIDAAAATARDVERARFDALIHDHVIATLLAAEGGHADDRLAAQARFALAELDAPAPATEAQSLTREAAATNIRVSIASVSDGVQVIAADPMDPANPEDRAGPGGSGDRRGAATEPRYPIEVVAAVGEALAEAVRNSLRHGGADAECVVFVEFGGASLQATAIDDGVGFEVADIPPERLGIEVSIRLRMSALAGGGSRIHSEPGRGTTVRVWWHASE